MSQHRSRVQGIASFRRLLRRLPDSSTAKLVAFLNAAGPPLAAEMRAQLPVLKQPRNGRQPGALRASIKWRVTPKSLNLKVGEISKRDIEFYGHILDVGRKAQTVNVTRRGGAPYPMRVSALPGLHVVSKVARKFRDGSLPGYSTLMRDILADASQGAGDD